MRENTPTVRLSTPGLLVTAFVALAITGCGEGGYPPANDDNAVPIDAEETRAGAVLGQPDHWEPAPEDGVELGFGWDSRRGRVVPNRCVSMTPVRMPGQVAQLHLSEVTDTSEVMKSLGVSASVSVKSIYGKASAAASFAKSSRVSASSSTFLLDAVVENGVIFAGPRGPADVTRSAYPSLDNESDASWSSNEAGRLEFQSWALNLARRPSEFRANCGDAFVSAISSGARLYATISFTSTSSTQSQNVKAAIKAEYGPVKASGAVKTRHENTLANTELEVYYLQVGGAQGQIAMSKEGLEEKLRNLAKETDQSPQLQFIRLTPYSRLPQWRGVDTWMDAEDELDIIADYYWVLSSLEAEIEAIVADYDAYNPKTGKSEAELTAFKDDVLKLRRLIWLAMKPDDDEEPETASAKFVAPGWSFEPFSGAPLKIFKAPQSVELGEIAGNPTIAELSRHLEDASPSGNPNLLRLFLPIPNAAPVSDPKGEEQLKQAVIDWYVAAKVRRACERDPTSNDCLSRDELAAVAAAVPVRP